MEGVFQKLFCSVQTRVSGVGGEGVLTGDPCVPCARRDNSLCSKIKQKYNQEKVQVQINRRHITFYCHNKGSTHRSVRNRKLLKNSTAPNTTIKSRCMNKAVRGSLVTISPDWNWKFSSKMTYYAFWNCRYQIERKISKIIIQNFDLIWLTP